MVPSSRKRFAYQFGSYLASEEDVAAELHRSNVLDQRRGVVGLRSFSIGLSFPVLFVCFAEGRRGNITGQIGVKMALDAVTSEALAIGSEAPSRESAAEENLSSYFVRRCIKEANRVLYAYARKMLSGEKIGTRVLLVGFDGETITLCRAGLYDGFLLRNGACEPLFEEVASRSEVQPLGMEDRITVDLATVRVRSGDTVAVSPVLPHVIESVLARISRGTPQGWRAQSIAATIVREGFQRRSEASEGLEEHPFALVLNIEEPAIELSQVVSD